MQVARVALEASLSVAAIEQPRSGPLDHDSIDRHDVGHVVILHQTEGGERFMSGITAEPFVSALLALEAGQLLIAAIEEILRSASDRWVRELVLLEILQRHRVGIVGRRRLLEAAMRFLQDALDSRQQIGQR